MEQNGEEALTLDLSIVKEEYIVQSNYSSGEQDGQTPWHPQIDIRLDAQEKASDPNSPKFSCSLCGKAFKKEWYLKMHLQTHSSEGNYACTMCDKKFLEEGVLDFHIKRVHLAVKPVNDVFSFRCSLCGMICPNKIALSKHLKLHAGVANFMSEDQIKQMIDHQLETPAECDICHKTFQGQKLLMKHKKIHFKAKEDIQVRTCPYCSRSFGSKESTRKHIARVHRGLPPIIPEGAVECTICNESFPDLDSLKEHVPSHPLEMSVECETCGKAFADESRLKDHRRFVHEKYQKYRQKLLPRFPCPQCGKMIKGKAHLEIHMTTHSNETPVECGICFKKFKYRNMVTRHIKIHAKERPSFTCHICGARLSYKETLKTHMKMKHQTEEILQQNHFEENRDSFPVRPFVVKSEVDAGEGSVMENSVPGIDCEVLIKTEGD